MMALTPEERYRRGFGDRDKSRRLRKAQLLLEEDMASHMRANGWDIFSPTVVCDRIGVREGRVFFIEFKPKERPRLRPGQKRIATLVPEMYKIVLH